MFNFNCRQIYNRILEAMRILFFLIFENLVSSEEKWFDQVDFEECELELSNGRISGKTILAGNKSIEIYRGKLYIIYHTLKECSTR